MRKILICLVVFMFLFTVEAKAADWVYRSFYSLKMPVNEKLDISLKSQFLFRDEMSEHYMTWVDCGFDYKAYDWLIVGLYYKPVRSKSSGKWVTEQRPHVNATLKGSIHGFKLSNRCRFEHRDFETSTEDDVRYRNQIKIVPPMHFTQFKITPFLEEEIFYSFNQDRLNMNWLTVGITFKIVGNLKGGISYRWNCSKNRGEWESKNILGTSLTYSF